MALVMQRYTRYLMRVQYSSGEFSKQIRTESRETHLHSHQETLAFNVSKAQVDTSGIALGISVSEDMLTLGSYASDESLRQS